MTESRSMNTTRRRVLRSTGVAITLPFLPSLFPRQAKAQAVKRFIALFFPNGSTFWEDWTFGGSGSTYTLGTAHASLAAHRAKFSMFKNLNGRYGGAPDHSRGTAEFLTGASISDRTVPKVAISIDQAMVNAVEPATAIRSLHLGPTPYPAGKPADTGWPSGYNLFISWSSPTAPNPAIEDAQVAFDRVFAARGSGGGGGGGQIEDPVLAKRKRLRQSVLDHVLDQVAAIAPRLGRDDGAKLDQYLTAIRDVEKRLQAQSTTVPGPPGPSTGPSCQSGTRPAAPDFATHTRAMLDILVLAIACGATHFATYSMDYGFGTKNDSHHNLGHSSRTQVIYDRHKVIVRWYMDQVAYFLGKLDAIGEGGATALDNSVVYIGSDVGDAWSHSHLNLTAILAGKGAGALNPGRLIDASGSSYASFLLALGQAISPKITSFAGTSTAMTGL